jgi:hypothetical protein
MTELDEEMEISEEENNIEEIHAPHPVGKQKVDGRKKARTPAQQKSFEKMIGARKQRAEEQLALREKKEKLVNDEVEEHIQQVKSKPKKKKKQVVVEQEDSSSEDDQPQIIYIKKPKKKKKRKQIVVREDSESESDEELPIEKETKPPKPKKEEPIENISQPQYVNKLALMASLGF